MFRPNPRLSMTWWWFFITFIFRNNQWQSVVFVDRKWWLAGMLIEPRLSWTAIERKRRCGFLLKFQNTKIRHFGPLILNWCLDYRKVFQKWWLLFIWRRKTLRQWRRWAQCNQGLKHGRSVTQRNVVRIDKMALNIFFSKVARVTQSRYIVNAINYFNGVYHQPTFVIRLSVSFVDIELNEPSSQ